MPKLRKQSEEMRRRKAKISLVKYRERNRDSDRFRNKLMLRLRRTDEQYYLESLKKNLINKRRQRYCQKCKDRKLLNMPETEFMIKEECKLQFNISTKTHKKYSFKANRHTY